MLILIFITIIASLISITNKYVRIDEGIVFAQCADLIQSKPFWKDIHNLGFIVHVWYYPSGMVLGARSVVFQLMKDYIERNGDEIALTRAQECDANGDGQMWCMTP